jgi:mono/diheme cytochrome c family protein
MRTTNVLSAKLVLVGAVVALSACTDSSKPPYDIMHSHMGDTLAVKAQHVGPWGEGMRTPPPGTLKVDAPEPYRYANDPEAAGKNLKNPLTRSKDVLVRGQTMYNTYCIVCHGTRGEGNGTIVPKYPQPPTLHSDKVKNWPDGNIYHVITMGQNLMPSYATQVEPQDRWAIVHYVRVLQRAQNPTEADLKLLKERTGR